VGKYSHVIDKLPRHPGTDPSHQQRIEATKERILLSDAEEEPLETVADYIRILHTTFGHLNELLVNAAAGQRHGSRFAKVYQQLRFVKDELEAHESNLNLLIEAYTALITDQFEVEGTTALTLDDGFNVRVQYEPYAQVEDREAFRQWCVANGYERSMTLPWQTTNSLVKARLIEGENEPPGVKAYSKTKTVLTKPR